MNAHTTIAVEPAPLTLVEKYQTMRAYRALSDMFGSQQDYRCAAADCAAFELQGEIILDLVKLTGLTADQLRNVL